jgi:hypothetical protein
MSDPEKESGKQKGLSNEAWTAIGTIAAALITGIFAIVTTWKSSPSPSPSTPPSESPTTPSSPSIPKPISSPTVSLSPSQSAQRLIQDLDAVNIDFSDSKERDHLSNSSSNYSQFAKGCLKLLNNQRLKKKVYFDVIFWNYTEELGGKVASDSPEGDLDTNILKAAMVKAYNTRNGSSALSFGDIVEPKQ